VTLLSRVRERMRSCHRFLGGIPHLTVGTHVLLTRPPLPLLPEDVRLACVRHAASVYPEPGSNSPFMFYMQSSEEDVRFIVCWQAHHSLDRLNLCSYVSLPLFSCSRTSCCFRICTPFRFLSGASEILSLCSLSVNRFLNEFCGIL